MLTVDSSVLQGGNYKKPGQAPAPPGVCRVDHISEGLLWKCHIPFQTLHSGSGMCPNNIGRSPFNYAGQKNHRR